MNQGCVFLKIRNNGYKQRAIDRALGNTVLTAGCAARKRSDAMQCPSCGSASCRRLEVIYDEGTANVDTTSHTSGVAGGLVGRHLAFGVGSASTTTSGVSRSRLAQTAAPPAAKPVMGWFITGFIALVAFSFISFGGHWLLDSIALAVVILCACTIVWAAWWNSTKLPEQQRHWRSAWMCGACGQTFVP